MSKDKLEDDAKKRVREETEQIERGDAPWQKSEKRGGFRDLFEDMWRDLEDPQDSKKDAAGRKGTFRPSSHLSRSGRERSHPQGRSAA